MVTLSGRTVIERMLRIDTRHWQRTIAHHTRTWTAEIRHTLAHVARDRITPPIILRLIAASNAHSYVVVRALVHNPNTPAACFKRFTTNPDINIRALASSSAYTPPRLLNQLAHDPDLHILVLLGQNPNTTPETLDTIANRAHELSDVPDGWMLHPKHLMLCLVAAHPNTLISTMRGLADLSLAVSIHGSANPNAPADLLERLAQTHTDPHLYRNLVVHKNVHLNTIIGILTNPENPLSGWSKEEDHAFDMWRKNILAGNCSDIQIAEYYARNPDDAEIGTLLVTSLLPDKG